MTIHEPATLLTDYLLALLGMVCGWKLGRLANPPQRWWSLYARTVASRVEWPRLVQVRRLRPSALSAER